MNAVRFVLAAFCISLLLSCSQAGPLRRFRFSGCRGSATVHDCGCYRGYCYSDCDNGLDGLFGTDPWCYTTDSYSQSFKYMKCTRDEDCRYDWACAGACSIWTPAPPVLLAFAALYAVRMLPTSVLLFPFWWPFFLIGRDRYGRRDLQHRRTLH